MGAVGLDVCLEHVPSRGEYALQRHEMRCGRLPLFKRREPLPWTTSPQVPVARNSPKDYYFEEELSERHEQVENILTVRNKNLKTD